MCEITLTPATAVLLAAVGCWSIGFWSSLSTCVSQTRCRAHRRCRRCIAAAATRAAPSGFAGLALALIGSDMWPSHSLAVAGASLVLGGLAGLTQADWRGVALAWLDASRKILTRGGAANDTDDDTGGSDAAS